VFDRSTRVSARPEEDSGRHVLVVGAARSGTTWVAEVLARTSGADYVHEPDSVDWVPFAVRARAGMGLLPAVEAGEVAPRLYAQLWDAAFSGRRRALRNRIAVPLFLSVARPQRAALPGAGLEETPARLRLAVRLAQPRSGRPGAHHHIVKSVQVPLSLEWLVARIRPTVLVVRRHPLDIVASRMGFGEMFLPASPAPIDHRAVARLIRQWGGPPRPDDGAPFEDLVWLTGFTVCAYDDVATAHPEFEVVDHEHLCAEPTPHFRRLVSALDLTWTERCEQFLRASNTLGAGFETNRLSDFQVGTWNRRLSSDQVRTARRILSQFPLVRRYPDLVA
jgi:hypothetical protein